MYTLDLLSSCWQWSQTISRVPCHPMCPQCVFYLISLPSFQREKQGQSNSNEPKGNAVMAANKYREGLWTIERRKKRYRKEKKEKKKGFSAIELLLQPIGFVFLNALEGTWPFFGLLLSRCPSIVSLVLSIFWPLEILSNFFHVVCIAGRGSKANSAIFFGRGHPGATTGQIMLR